MTELTIPISALRAGTRVSHVACCDQDPGYIKSEDRPDAIVRCSPPVWISLDNGSVTEVGVQLK
jgi:hypothetical protein